MDVLIVVTLILAACYGLVAQFLLRATLLPASSKNKKLTVAVLIAMRNEEENITDCLNALTQQTYPNNLYDVYVLDDSSTDRSPEIVRTFAKNHKNIHLIPIQKEQNGLKGKMNALAQGIKQTAQELLLVTDADCVVSPTWIERMVNYFDETTGMVGGLTVLFPFGNLAIANPPKTLFARIQAMDWLFLQTLAALNSMRGKPITILGNNFAFRRSAYQQVGGFESIGFSVTEDFALMEAIRKKTQWTIRHTLDRLNAIYSRPTLRFTDFLQQRLRWVKGGRSMRAWGYFIISLSIVAHWLVVFSFLAGGLLGMKLLALLILLLTDWQILQIPLKKLQLRSLNVLFPLFEGFYFFYLLIFSVLAFLPLKIRWKGRIHN